MEMENHNENFVSQLATLIVHLLKNYSPQMTKQVELSLLMHNYYVA